MIQNFPTLKDNQFVMLRNNLYTGHVVDASMVLATSEEQEIWTTYDSIDMAISDATLIVGKYDHIECSIFDKDRNRLHLIQPS